MRMPRLNRGIFCLICLLRGLWRIPLLAYSYSHFFLLVKSFSQKCFQTWPYIKKENWQGLNKEYSIFYTKENYISFVHSDGSTIVEPIIKEFWDADEVGLVYRYSTKQGWGLLSYKGEILHEANLSSDAVYDIAKEWIDKMQNEEWK